MIPLLFIRHISKERGNPIDAKMAKLANTFFITYYLTFTLQTALSKLKIRTPYLLSDYPTLLIKANATKNEIILKMTETPTPHSAALPAEVAFLGDLSRSVR